jgi:hypothetical protein
MLFRFLSVHWHKIFVELAAKVQKFFETPKEKSDFL